MLEVGPVVTHPLEGAILAIVFRCHWTVGQSQHSEIC